MAIGDITRDSNSPFVVGDHVLLTGTIECGDTLTAYAIAGTGVYILGCTLEHEDGVGSAEVKLNQDASATTTNGTIAVYANHPTASTYRYEIRAIGPV